MSITFASSSMVNSPGFPRLNGPTCSPSIRRIRPSTYCHAQNGKILISFSSSKCGSYFHLKDRKEEVDHNTTHNMTKLHRSEILLGSNLCIKAKVQHMQLLCAMHMGKRLIKLNTVEKKEKPCFFFFKSLSPVH